MPAIAEVTSGRWAVTARAAARAIHANPNEESDAGLRLLEDVRALFAEKKDRPSLHTHTIVQALVALEDRPWSEYGKKGVLTPRDVAALLGHFHVESTTMRVGGVLGKVYRPADSGRVFERYV